LSFSCIFKMVPEHKFAVIILDNSVGRDMTNSTKKAFEMMLPLKPEVVPEPLPMNESEMAEYAGNYSQDPGNPKAIASVIAKGGKLSLNGGSGRHEVPVEKVGKNRFAIIMPGIDPSYFGFVPGEDGRIKYLHSGLRAYPKIES
jgi:hypothetical protein